MKNSFFRDLFNKKSDVVEEAKDPSKIFKALKIIVIVILAIVVISGGFYNVSEQENAVVTMFGRVVRTDTAGLYFKIPLIQKVHYVDITTHGTGVGYSIDNNGIFLDAQHA